MILRLLLVVVVPAAGAFAALYFYAAGARYVTTDNAYVKADMIAVSPSIGGRVTSVSVDDNQAVRAGDVLFVLDERPHLIALAQADAGLDAIRNDLDSLRAQYAQTQAEIADADERVKYLQRQYERQQELRSRGMATEATIDETAYQVIQARQSGRALQQKARQTLAALGGDPERPAEQHPRYLEAMARRDEAELDLSYTVVRAPADGIVSRMQLQAGEWLEEGDPVFRLLVGDRLWVEANLKETQLTFVQVGQKVRLEVDAYPGVEWRGEIESISPAAGSEFLVLPPQNATGNWVKVVQRVPVRIRIERAEGQPPLRAGMTADVSVDTERDSELFLTLRDSGFLSFVREAVASIRGVSNGDP